MSHEALGRQFAGHIERFNARRQAAEQEAQQLNDPHACLCDALVHCPMHDGEP